MKIATIGALAAAALLLTACSGGDEPTGPSATPSETLVAEGPTSSPDPTVGNLDDPLCAAAAANLASASDLEAKSTELTDLMQDPDFFTSDDPTVLNEWGEQMLALTDETQQFYVLGVSETAGEDVNVYFTTLNDFVEKYSKAMASAAAEAASPTDFFTAVQPLLTDAATREVLTAAPGAAQEVATYMGTRCGITG